MCFFTARLQRFNRHAAGFFKVHGGKVLDFYKEWQVLVIIIHCIFFLKFLADTCPVLGPLVPLFWISGDVSSGFQSQSGLPYSHCGGKRNVHSPRSTSGATLANLLAAGAQSVLSPHTVAEVRLLGFKLVLSEYL